MARLPAIIDLIAKHDTRSVATINNYARVLREAGVLSKGKRGRGAPHLTTSEAADLILGLAGASDAVGAPHAVSALRQAVLEPKATKRGGDLVDAHKALAEWTVGTYGENFGKVLEAIIAGEPTRLDNDGSLPGVFDMSVTISEVTPGVRFASAEVMLDEGEESVTFSFKVAPTEDDIEKWKQSSPDYDPLRLGLSWSRSTTIYPYFFADLGACLSAGEGEE